jgi:hypothetical protein
MAITEPEPATRPPKAICSQDALDNAEALSTGLNSQPEYSYPVLS